jgi:hypothetical protein
MLVSVVWKCDACVRGCSSGIYLSRLCWHACLLQLALHYPWGALQQLYGSPVMFGILCCGVCWHVLSLRHWHVFSLMRRRGSAAGAFVLACVT